MLAPPPPNATDGNSQPRSPRRRLSLLIGAALLLLILASLVLLVHRLPAAESTPGRYSTWARGGEKLAVPMSLVDRERTNEQSLSAPRSHYHQQQASAVSVPAGTARLSARPSPPPSLPPDSSSPSSPSPRLQPLLPNIEALLDETASVLDSPPVYDYLEWMQRAADGHLNTTAPEWLTECQARVESVETSLSEQARTKLSAWATVQDEFRAFASDRRRAIPHSRRRVLLHLGWLAFQPEWARAIRQHELSPSSEWLLWSDLIVGLCALGYEIDLVNTKQAMDEIVQPEMDRSVYEWIVTDYDGLGQLETSGFFPYAYQDPALVTRDVRHSHHCQTLLLDAMGTDAEHIRSHRNHSLTHFLPGMRYTDSGLNQGLGHLASTDPYVMTRPRGRRKRQAVLWGKFPQYFTRTSNASHASNEPLLEHLARRFSDGLVVTMADVDYQRLPQALRQHITRNAGLLVRPAFLALLKESLVLVGLGEPRDGLTALEAMAVQTVYLNPTRWPAVPYSSEVTHSRPYTSQNMYVEQRIPPPLSYTLDLHSSEQLDATLDEIFAHAEADNEADRSLPSLPPEYYAYGYVRNLAHILLRAERTCDPQRTTVFVHPNNVRQFTAQRTSRADARQ